MTAPEVPQMSPELAQEWVQRGATLLCLDVPAGIEFGIDYCKWTTGAQFRGVKMIPPGMHFVHYSVGANVPDVHSFFVRMDEADVVVRRWSAADECFEEEDAMDGEERERFVAGVRRFDFDRHLGPYPHNTWNAWHGLASFITQKVVARLDAHRKVAVLDVSDPARTEERSKEMLVEVPYTTIPPHFVPAGASPADVTKHMMDKSALLLHLLATELGGSEGNLLGEVQYAFIMFILGNSFESFEQWKKWLCVLCSCEDAVLTKPRLFSRFIGVFKAQLEQAPEDFFINLLSENNFLKPLLKGFFEIVDDEGVQAELRASVVAFRAYVSKRFHWDFASEIQGDEFSPAVVVTGESWQ